MVDLNGILLKNRFLVSSGALALGEGYFWQKPLIFLKIIDPAAFGGVCTKTLTLQPRSGNLGFSWPGNFFEIYKKRKEVLRKIPIGWVNRVGLWNPGIDYFLMRVYPRLKNINLIVSIFGDSIEEYLELIRKLNRIEISAIELNLSCPVAKKAWQDEQKELNLLFHFAVGESNHPLILKIGPDQNWRLISYFAQWYGVKALHLFNTLPYRIWLKKERKWFEGGLSGKRLKPLSVFAIRTLKKEINLPLIGGGGIYSLKDCQDYFEAGASAVSFGSVFLEKPWLPNQILRRKDEIQAKWG